MKRPPHPLTSLRALTGDTQQSYAELVAETYASLGFGKLEKNREKVSRWETQGIEPHLHAQLAIAHIHQVPEEEVQHLGWPHWLHLGTAAAPRATRRRIREALADASPDTERPTLHPARSRLTLTGPALTSLARHILTVSVSPPSPAHHGHQVTPDTVALMEDRTNALHAMVPTINPMALQRMARTELDLATDLLAYGNYDRATGTRLHLITSQTASLCGLITGSLGDYTRAERYQLAAVRAAGHADSPLRASACLADLALSHIDAGNSKDASSLIGAARTLVPDPPPRLAALLWAREARAHAKLGEIIASVRALDQAANAVALSAAGDGSALHRNIDGEWLSRTTGKAWLDAGQPQQALDHLVGFLEDTPLSRTPPLLTAKTLLDAVDAQLALGEIEAAVHSTRRALSLFDRMPTGLTRLYQRRFAPRYDIPAVRDLLALLTRSPAP